MKLEELEKKINIENIQKVKEDGNIKSFVRGEKVWNNSAWHNMINCFGIFFDGNKYCVFFTEQEKGIPYFKKKFNDEESACNYLYERLIKLKEDMDNAEWNYEISCIEVGKHKHYLPIFENDSENGVLSELFSERISFKKNIDEAISCKKDFCGNAVGFHYEDNTDSFDVYGIIEDANEDDHVYIKRPDLEELIRKIETIALK